MKSAYELAMEKLEAASPSDSRPLTDAQKRKLKVIEQQYRAKIAEREIFLQKKLQESIAGGDSTESEAIERQLKDERIRLEQECESKKEAVRQQ